MKEISIEAFRRILHSKQNDPTVDFINVCTPAEYREKHIEGVRSLPLDELEARIDELKDKKEIYIHCRSGRRGERAARKLQELGVTATLWNVQGGLLAWEEAGFETRSTSRRIPIMRQVFIAAGMLVSIGSLATLIVDPRFAYLTLAVGAGLTFAGMTGKCGMALVLSKMPWNKN